MRSSELRDVANVDYSPKVCASCLVRILADLRCDDDAVDAEGEECCDCPAEAGPQVQH